METSTKPTQSAIGGIQFNQDDVIECTTERDPNLKLNSWHGIYYVGYDDKKRELVYDDLNPRDAQELIRGRQRRKQYGALALLGRQGHQIANTIDDCVSKANEFNAKSSEIYRSLNPLAKKRLNELSQSKDIIMIDNPTDRTRTDNDVVAANTYYLTPGLKKAQKQQPNQRSDESQNFIEIREKIKPVIGEAKEKKPENMDRMLEVLSTSLDSINFKMNAILDKINTTHFHQQGNSYEDVKDSTLVSSRNEGAVNNKLACDRNHNAGTPMFNGRSTSIASIGCTNQKKLHIDHNRTWDGTSCELEKDHHQHFRNEYARNLMSKTQNDEPKWIPPTVNRYFYSDLKPNVKKKKSKLDWEMPEPPQRTIIRYPTRAEAVPIERYEKSGGFLWKQSKPDVKACCSAKKLISKIDEAQTQCSTNSKPLRQSKHRDPNVLSLDNPHRKSISDLKSRRDEMHLKREKESKKLDEEEMRTRKK